MKKVINITIGSVVFAIEQEAFEMLEVYLGAIKNNLKASDDSAEVVEDVERAIAEKFLARKRSEKAAVLAADVRRVMAEMGDPADFGEAETAEAVNRPETNSSEPKKRLYRDTENAVMAGVAGGLANYFDADPVIVRLLFVVGVFFNGFSILVYVIMWLVVPAAHTTTAEKYAMRGERVTLREISERVQKKIENIDGADMATAKSVWGRLRSLLNKAFSFLGQVARYLYGAARYVFGFLFLAGGAFAIAGLVSVYTIVLLSDPAFIPADAQTALDIMLGGTLGAVAITASFVMMLIPLLVLVLVGGGLLSKRTLFTASNSITLAVIWIVSVVLAATTSVLLLQQVMPAIDPGLFDDGRFEIQIETEVR